MRIEQTLPNYIRIMKISMCLKLNMNTKQWKIQLNAGFAYDMIEIEMNGVTIR